ncbi:MAG: hypothetical protein NTX66_02210 [Candidatus Falkowbacteria bacterium]|nr:hypothetical protein [Candidatus Falkowbacteria bacterium]
MNKLLQLSLIVLCISLLFVAPGQAGNIGAGKMVDNSTQQSLVLKAATIALSQNPLAAQLAEKLKNFSFSFLLGENMEFWLTFENQTAAADTDLIQFFGKPALERGERALLLLQIRAPPQIGL